jgi:antitoxin ParD1/3/4
MNVSLTRELEEFVDKKVSTGLYQTASEVVREGLRLLKERDDLQQRKLEDLRRDIAIGLEEAERGDVTTVDAGAVLKKVRARRISRKTDGRADSND